MKIEFENSNGETLCFHHAVKAVVEDNENVRAVAFDNSNPYDMGGTGYLGGVCIKCFPEEPEEDYDD